METSPLGQPALGSLVAGLLDLDADAVETVMLESHRDSAPSLISELLVPAHSELRRRHRDGDVDRATLAAATELLRKAVLSASAERMRPHLYPVSERAVVASDRPRVVVACPVGTEHLLGAEAVAEMLGGLGWPTDVVNETDALLGRHLSARSAMALVVSCTDESGLPSVARAVDTAHGVGVPVIVTGAALGDDGLRALRLGADVWISSISAIPFALDGWRSHHIPVAGPQGLPEEYARFASAEAAVVAGALGVSGAGASDEEVRAFVRSVVSRLGSAVLVDDSRILLDHLALHLGQDEAEGLSELAIVDLVDAVAGAVPPELGRARKFICEARENLRRTLLRSSRTLRTVEPTGPTPSSPAGRDEVLVPGISGAGGSPGQAFADLLLLGAMACQAPVAVLSVPQADGQWSTLSYGFEQRHGLNDPLLFEALVRREEATEFSDMATASELSRSPLVGPPHSLRWAYGVALRSPEGSVLGVFCVLDRCLRQLTRREQRATMAVGRQMAVQLLGLRKPAVRPDWSAAPVPPHIQASMPNVPPAPSLVGLRRTAQLPESQQLLRSHEVAVLFDVTERTVINWAAAGKLPSLRTIGGHLRFRNDDVHNLLAGRRIAT